MQKNTCTAMSFAAFFIIITTRIKMETRCSIIVNRLIMVYLCTLKYYVATKSIGQKKYIY